MSLADRRANAPHHLGTMPMFQLQTPNRTMRRLSVDSVVSLDSIATRTTLPEYMAQADDNPDVITTSIEIDPDCDDSDDEISITPPAVLLTPTNERKTKKSGLSKLFSRTTVKPQSQAPGVRLTRAPHLLRTRSKDPRSGFPLAMPLSDCAPVVPVTDDAWMHVISRINILLSNRQVSDVQTILESDDALKDRVSLIKLSEAKSISNCTTLEVPQPVSFVPGSASSVASSFLTIPELQPRYSESDDDCSRFKLGRRGSIISTCSSSGSIRSSISQKIKERFQVDEVCLLFD